MNSNEWCQRTIFRVFIMLLLLTVAVKVVANDTIFIKVHFLYGSKPQRAFKDTESKWLGGRLGGHVGIEVEPNKIIDFVPSGKFHWFAKPNNKHSKFVIHDEDGFWTVFGGRAAAAKKASITIPITADQKQRLDQIFTAYTTTTPYDYAFVGMRCAAAAYDILSQLGIVKAYSYHKTYRKIYYPRKLRKQLLKKATKHGWAISKQPGISDRRKWERG